MLIEQQLSVAIEQLAKQKTIKEMGDFYNLEFELRYDDNSKGLWVNIYGHREEASWGFQRHFKDIYQRNIKEIITNIINK